MTLNPYVPPSAQVADPVDPSISRPRPVTVAMILFCTSVVVETGELFVLHRDRFTGESILVSGVSIALTVGLCVAIGARRNWARWVYAAVILLPWLGNFRAIAGWLRQPRTSTDIIILGADAMVLLALILLFTGPSNRWFKQPRAPG